MANYANHMQTICKPYANHVQTKCKPNANQIQTNLISSRLIVLSRPRIRATESGPALTLSLSVTWTGRDSARRRAGTGSAHSDWYRHTGTACHRAAAFQTTPRHAGESLNDCLTPSPGSEASLRLEPSAGPPRRQAAGRCGTGSRPLSDCVGLPRRTPSGS